MISLKKIIIGILVTITSSGLLFLHEKPDGFLHIYFLNIGQGDSIFIKTPTGKHILVDGGPGKNVLSELKDVLPSFNASFDYVISTHPDRDHLEGLISVVEKYKINKIIFTGASNQKGNLNELFLKKIREKNIPVIIGEDDHDIMMGDGVFIDILFPFTAAFDVKTNTNDASIVAKVTYGENEILFTGDMEASVEEKLIGNNIDINADILKVAHHGSKTSTTEGFLKKVSPQWSVISVGKDNSYHHPHPSVLNRLKMYGGRTLRTDTEGRVEFVLSKEGVVCIKTEKQENCNSSYVGKNE